MKSYDDRQMDNTLVRCQKCKGFYYMKAAVCAFCGPGFRTEQNPPPSKLDVNGNVIDGP